MALIRIKKEELLFQIDQQSKGQDLPSVLYIEGVTALLDDEVHAFDRDYPQYVDVFTRIELAIVREFYESLGHPMTANRFLSLIHSSRAHGGRLDLGIYNNVCVHIKNIRRKMKAKGMPFTIKNVRRGLRSDVPTYMLTSSPHQ